MYRLVVFDWDGTLMDSERRIVSCLQAAARDVRVAIPSGETTRLVIGLGLAESIMELFPDANSAQQQALTQAYRKHFLHFDGVRSELFVGTEIVLNKLFGAKYLLAIATGKSRRGLERELEETGVRHYFHSTRCADETLSKPHPRMLHEILVELKIDPQQALIVGDTEYDMKMAICAGAHGLGVAYGMHPPRRLLESGARDVIETIDDLPDWLKQFST